MQSSKSSSQKVILPSPGKSAWGRCGARGTSSLSILLEPCLNEAAAAPAASFKRLYRTRAGTPCSTGLFRESAPPIKH
jgi:hypothetical protein